MHCGSGRLAHNILLAAFVRNTAANGYGELRIGFKDIVNCRGLIYGDNAPPHAKRQEKGQPPGLKKAWAAVLIMTKRWDYC